jgi:hypothetical protein
VLRELAVLLGAFRPPGEPMRRIGVLMYLAADDAEGQARLAAFAQALKQLGWSDGRNLRIDTRWANADDIRKHAAELVALAPDVLLAATGTATVAPLLQATRTVPIVFRRIPTADPPPRRQGLHSKKAALAHAPAQPRRGARCTEELSLHGLPNQNVCLTYLLIFMLV